WLLRFASNSSSETKRFGRLENRSDKPTFGSLEVAVQRRTERCSQSSIRLSRRRARRTLIPLPLTREAPLSTRLDVDRREAAVRPAVPVGGGKSRRRHVDAAATAGGPRPARAPRPRRARRLARRRQRARRHDAEQARTPCAT